jgi:flagellar biosynthesis/type III secretory pathway M-ring protein FliF/YscJ
LRDWFETVSIYYQKTGNYKMALAYTDSTRRLEQKEYDTANNMRLLRVEQAANALDMKLVNAEKDKIHRSFLFALSIVVLLLIIAVLIFINHLQIRRKNISLVAQIKELQELQQIKEDELLQKNTFETPETDAAELCPESRKDKICIALRDLLLKDKIYRNETL